jgi:Tol biopolymer transport system component
MLTGRPAFGRATRTDTLAAIIDGDPDWAALPANTPAHVRPLLRRCLKKDPKARLRDIADARAELNEPASPPARGVSASRTGLYVLAVIATLSTALALWMGLRPAPPLSGATVRFAMPPPPEQSFLFDVPVNFLAMSPDGSTVAFTAGSNASPRAVWIRPMNAAAATRLAGTEGAYSAFWSPDGRSLAFFVANQLKRIDLATGTVTPIFDITDAARQAGSWGSAGTIVFASQGLGRIQTVPAAGGVPETLVSADSSRDETRVQWPWFLPDGRRVIYLTRFKDNSGQLTIVERGGKPRHIAPMASNAQFVNPGFIVFARDGALIAQGFDQAAEKLTGEPVAVADAVNHFLTTARASFAASLNGSVVYHAGMDMHRMKIFDRSGRQLGDFGAAGGYLNLEVSPDGTRVLFDRRPPKSSTWDLWIADLARGSETRLTSDPGSEVTAVWTPDGRGIVYGADRNGGPPHLFFRNLDTGEDRELQPAGLHQQSTSVSPDGRTVAFNERNERGNFELRSLQLDHPSEAIRLGPVSDSFDVSLKFSPDGQAFTFTSGRSGTMQVYAALVGQPMSALTVSNTRAGVNRWSRDGRELFYLTADTLMSVPIRTGPRLEVGASRRLFDGVQNWIDYDFLPDGRILAIVTESLSNNQPINVVLNFTAGLPARQ